MDSTLLTRSSLSLTRNSYCYQLLVYHHPATLPQSSTKFARLICTIYKANRDWPIFLFYSTAFSVIQYCKDNTNSGPFKLTLIINHFSLSSLLFSSLLCRKCILCSVLIWCLWYSGGRRFLYWDVKSVVWPTYSPTKYISIHQDQS